MTVPLSRVSVSWACPLTDCICLQILTVTFGFFCLHRETVTTFYFLGCLQDSETVMADLALSGVVFKE